MANTLQSKVTLFYELCRLCLDKPGACSMFQTEELPRDIFSCTGVKVSPSDNLPQNICTECYKIILNAKELRNLATKNDKNLRSLFDCEADEKVNNMAHFQDCNNYGNVSSVLDVSLSAQSSYFKCGDRTRPNSKKSNDNDKQSSKTNDTPAKKSIISVRKDLTKSSTSLTTSIKVLCTESGLEFKKIRKKKLKKEDNEVEVFKCQMCSKSFDKWKKLYLHQRLHNKTLACPLDVCGKMFATKGDLQKHIRAHTGEKPFQCDMCEKTFTQNGSLKVHKETVHCSLLGK